MFEYGFLEGAEGEKRRKRMKIFLISLDLNQRPKTRHGHVLC